MPRKEKSSNESNKERKCIREDKLLFFLRNYRELYIMVIERGIFMKYYCIGIKGSGMSTLAQILYDMGNEVSGYDDSIEHKYTEEGLNKRGITVYHDHMHSIDQDTIVTYSKAFQEDHPELQRVREQGLKIISYNELLGHLTELFETTCVCGTHGKTTTSLLISHIMQNTIGCNYFVGDGSGYANKKNKRFIMESCEYNRHFLAYHPTNVILTNIELEHTECYDGLDDIIHTFQTFVQKATGIAIMCGDDQNVRKIASSVKTIYYGFDEKNDLIAKNVKLTNLGSEFDVYQNQKFYGHFSLPLFGKHMILNALAAIAICDYYGISAKDIEQSVHTFKGAKRRFKETCVGDTVIIDDYAHHPTELRVTLEAAHQKCPNKELVAVFLPNTYSRTLALLNDFVEVLKKADKAYIMDIHCDRERKEDYQNVSSDMLIEQIPNSEKISENSVEKLLKHKNAVICFMSCADIYVLERKYEDLLGVEHD